MFTFQLETKFTKLFSDISSSIQHLKHSNRAMLCFDLLDVELLCDLDVDALEYTEGE